MFERKLALKLKQLIDKKDEFNNVILIEGARQVGKTTLVRQVLRGVPYLEINLEEERGFTEKIDQCPDFSAFADLLAVERRFVPGGETVLFIDEAQESRKLGSFVRFMKEKWPHTHTILSGSMMSHLFRGETRYPVGRVALFHVQPLSFEEFLLASREDLLLEKLTSFASSSAHSLSLPVHERLLTLLDQYLMVGGLPDVVSTYCRGDDWKSVRDTLLFGYYSDFKRVCGEERQAYLVAALKAAAYVLGGPFKNSAVSQLLDGGKNKWVIEAVTQLEAWRMLFKVDQLGAMMGSDFHPKRYVFDTGIAKHLRESARTAIGLVDTKDSLLRTPLGGIIENAVATVLLTETHSLSGWRKSASGSEVDFVMHEGSTAIPIECKSAMAIKGSHLGGVRDFMTIHDVPVGIVVSLSPFEKRNLADGRRMMCMPLYAMERWKELYARM